MAPAEAGWRPQSEPRTNPQGQSGSYPLGYDPCVPPYGLKAGAAAT